jgi:hypothetical protein
MLTADQKDLLRAINACGFSQLIGPAPEILTELVRDGLAQWHWNDGIPIYSLTDAGVHALTQG